MELSPMPASGSFLDTPVSFFSTVASFAEPVSIS